MGRGEAGGGTGEEGEGLFPGSLLNNLATSHHPVGSFWGFIFSFFSLNKKKKPDRRQKRLHGAGCRFSEAFAFSGEPHERFHF